MIVVLSLPILTCLALPSWSSCEVLQLQAEVLADDRPAGQDRHVLEHRLAAVAEAGGLHRADVQDAAELVDDQRRQGFAVDVLGDDDSGWPLCATFSRSGIISRRLLIFFSWRRIRARRRPPPSSSGW